MNEPSLQRDDEQLAERAGRMLRQGAEGLDAATRSRLNRARQAALAEFDRGGAATHRFPARWNTGVAFAAVAAIALGIGVTARGPLWPPAPAARSAEAAEVDLLLADENLEMLDELDFYDWLGPDEGPAAPDAGQSLAG
jgi:hypothetical protein